MANLKGFYRDESAKKACKVKPVTLSELKAKIEQDPALLTEEEHRLYDSFMERVYHGIKPEPRPKPKVVRL